MHYANLLVFFNEGAWTWWGWLLDRPVIIDAPFELSLAGNGRAVTLIALMIHTVINTTVWDLTTHNFVPHTIRLNYNMQMGKSA